MMQRALVSMGSTPDERASNSNVTLRRLLGELRPYGRQIAAALAATLISAAAQAAGPWLISLAIDRNISRGDRPGLAMNMSFLLAVYVIGTFAGRWQAMQIGTIGQRILAAIRVRLFDRLQRLPLAFFDRRAIGDLISRVTNDVDTLNQFLSQGLTQTLGSLFGIVGIVAAMLALSVDLALASFVVIPLMLLLTKLFGRLSRRAFRATRQTTGDVTADLQEEIVGVRQAQAFNRTSANIARFRERNQANRRANVQATAITSAFAPAVDILGTLATAVVIGYGSYLAFQGTVSIGVLAAFLLYVQQFFRPIQLLSQLYTQAQAALAGSERIYNILDQPEEPSDMPDAVHLGVAQGRIDFEHVTFGYTSERAVLRDLMFHVEPGQTVALVGRTGAGKTTIANLLARFYDTDQGTIYLDGVDIRQITRASLRAQIAMVLQEPFLFSGRITDNIGFGREGASPAEILAAAQAVGAHPFLSSLADGYNTVLSEGGGNLSQGQRQLLAFARAVLANPRILILDEATSTLDTRTEALIQQALATLLAGRTSVVIAHRLSTIIGADQILVIDHGQIVERGTHASLLALAGVYRELYERQFREPPPAPTWPAGPPEAVETALGDRRPEPLTPVGEAGVADSTPRGGGRVAH